MKVLSRKYWWLCVILVLLPIALNYILLIPSFSPVVGNEVNWLSFWGGYLGSLISASVAFIILFVQRSDNKSQNEQNRVTNKNENEVNRKLQIGIMKYQLDLNNLNQFKNACIACQRAYAYNSLCEIANLTNRDKTIPLTRIKELFAEAASAHRGVDIIDYEENEYTSLFLCQHKQIYKMYTQALLDLEVLVSYLDYTPDDAEKGLMGDGYSSASLKQLIMNEIGMIHSKGVAITIKRIINLRLDLVDKDFIESLWEEAFKYINYEKDRINNTLLEIVG